jgi:tyrosinase
VRSKTLFPDSSFWLMSNRQRHKHKSSTFWMRILYLALLPTIFLAGWSLWQNKILHRPQSVKYSECSNPPQRKEWRELEDREKTEYTRAILCLSTVPSKLGINGTMYDDFALLHQEDGSRSELLQILCPYLVILKRNIAHHFASFLPWHRYILHLYETMLKRHCGFTNQLP